MTQYKYKYYVGNNRTHFVCIIKHLDDVCINKDFGVHIIRDLYFSLH